MNAETPFKHACDSSYPGALVIRRAGSGKAVDCRPQSESSAQRGRSVCKHLNYQSTINILLLIPGAESDRSLQICEQVV